MSIHFLRSSSDSYKNQSPARRRQKVRRILWQGMETLEHRQMLASDWTNVLQPLNVKGDAAQTVTPLDVLIVINEINAPSIRDSTSSPLPPLGPGKTPPPYVDVDCDNFVTPLDVLIIINAINTKDIRPSWRFFQSGGGDDAGSITPAACHPKLEEGSSFITSLVSDVEIPADANLLSFEYTSLSFDTSSQGRALDAFEAALLDSSGRSLVPTLGNGRDAFFNVTEGMAVANTQGVTINGNKVSVSLSDILPGTKAQLVLRLVNNDGDKTSSVVVPSVRFENSPPLRLAPPSTYGPSPLQPSTSSVTGQSILPANGWQGPVLPGTNGLPGADAIVGRTPTHTGSNATNSSAASRPPSLPAPPINSNGQGTIDTRGTEFWVGFPDNLFEGNNRPQKVLYVTGDVATTGVVDIPGLIDPSTSRPFHRDIVVNPGEVTVIELPSMDVNDTDDDETDYDVEVELVARVQRKGIHVVTQEPVTVYGLDMAVNTSDAFLALPVDSLGTEYINLGYENTYASISHIEGTQYLVVATEDDTQVTLAPGQYSGATTSSIVRLVRPNGTSDFTFGNSNGRDIGPLLTDFAGTGKIEIKPPFDGYSGKYNFELIDVATAAIPSTLGEKTTANYTTGRESKVFSFDVTAGQQLYYDAINGGTPPSVSVRLISPSGEFGELNSQNDNNSFVNLFGALQFRETGKYYVVVTGEQSTAFDFSFRLVDMNAAPKLNFSTDTTGASNPGGRAELYRIDGTAGQVVYFDALNPDRGVSFNVYGPGGEQLVQVTASDDRVFVLPETSTYYVVVNSGSFFPSSFGFQLLDLKAAPTLSFANPTTTAVSGGRVTAYRFAGTPAQTFSFDVQSVAPDFRVTYQLIDPAGNVVNLSQSGIKRFAKLLTAGNYTLLIGALTVPEGGNVTIMPSLIADPVVAKSGLNSEQTLTIAAGGSATYEFSAPAGTRLVVDGLDNASENLYIEFNAPDGTRLFGNFDFYNEVQDIPRFNPVFLPQSGTYKLTLRGNTQTDAGSYKFRVLDLDTFGTPISFDTLVDASRTNPRETTVYTFDATVGDKILFDGVSGSYAFGLYDSFLNEKYSRGVFGATQVSEVDGTMRITQTGRHYIIFHGEQNVTPDYSFQVRNLSAAPVLNFGSEVTGTVAGNSQDVYRLSLTSGQRLRFDNLLPYITNINFKIYNAGGRTVFDSGFQNVDSGPPGNNLIVAPDTGEYFFYVQSRTTTPINYRFTLDDLAASPLLTFDVDSEVILNPGNAARVFRIDAAAGETLQFDNLGALQPLNWGVTGPITQFLGGHNDGGDFSVKVLSTGSYYFTISGRQDSGPLSVRFRATRTSNPVVPLTGFNTVVNLDVGLNETKSYSFTAPTGRLVYLNVLQSQFAIPTHTVTLNQGETYLMRDLAGSGVDLTGSIITSTKPVAVFGGNRATFIPSEFFAADHLVEQLPPTNTWGREFVTMPLVTGSTRGELYRFLAQADGTQLTINGTVVATLNRGQFYEQVLTQPGHILSNQPILVAQYAHSQNYYRTNPGGNPNFLGDPLMMIVPPFEQFLANYTVSTPAASSILNAQRFDRNFINIVAPAEAVGLIEIDGVTINASQFVAIGTSGFWGAQVPVELGSYQLAGPLPFGVFVYGFGAFDSYGYVGGQALSPVATVGSVVLTPENATPTVGNSLVLRARVADSSGAPLSGVRVDFDVAGVNPQRGFGFSDENGLVEFSYIGSADGRDIVTASVGQLLDDSIVDWKTGAEAPQIIVTAPLHGSSVAAGTTLVATGLAIADFPLAALDLVTVNGVPITTVDAAGNFFAQLFVGPGDNEFEFVAIDSNGNTGSQIITITGTQRDTSQIDFSQFADVSGSFRETYARSSYNQNTRSFFAQTAIENTGNFPTDVPLLVGITNISDPRVLVRDADGYTPEGIPYYDFTGLVTGGSLNPQAKTGFLFAEFYNPNQTQFTYDLVFYGKLNEPPQIQSLPSLEAEIGREYQYDVLATDPNNDAITYELSEAPAGMTINSSTGEIHWSPSANDLGVHTIEIRVTDTRLGVSTQRFGLSVHAMPSNRTPVITSLPVAIAETGKVYAQTVQAVDADGDALAYRLVSAPAGMTINATTGSLQWTPTPQQLGTQSVVVEVSDSRGGVAQQSFSLTVLSPAENTSPVIVSSAPTATKLSGFTYQVVALDADSEALSYRLLNAPTGMAINSTGLITWTPTLGQHAVAIEVMDARGGRAEQRSTLTVYNNQDPVITSQPITVSQINSPYSYQVTATDSVGEILAFSLIDAPAGMTINAASGLIQWNVASSAHAQEPVKVRVSDGRGGIAMQQFVVSVAGGQSQANTNPIFISTPPSTASLGAPLVYQARARDSDGDSLTFDLPLSPHGMVIDAATGLLGWIPQSNQTGMQQVVIRVQDGRGGIWLQSFQIQVDGANTAPVITSAPVTTATVGAPWEYRLHAQDANNDPVIFELVSPASGMSLVSLSNADANAVLSFTPTTAGSVEVVLLVKDSRGGQTEQRFTLQVAATSANAAPIIHSSPRLTIPAGQTWAYLISADEPNGDPITLSLPSAPTGMTLDSGLRAITWTPTVAQLGDHEMVLTVSDGRGGAISQSVTLHVASDSENVAPRIVSPPSAFRATVGAPFQYDLKAADDDGDPVEWTLVDGPAGASLDRRYGTLRWTPTLEQLGLQRFIIVAKDPLGLDTLQSFSLNVSGSNLGPSILSRAPSEAVVDESYVYGIRALDPENDLLDFAIQSGPSGMTIDSQRGILRWRPTLGQLGTADVTVEVTDSHGNKSSQRFQIDVVQLERNREPVITSRAIFRARVGAEYQYDVNAIDPEADAIEYSLLSAPTGMQIDSSTGLIRWTPTTAQAGSHLIQVVAQDSAGGRSLQRFAILARVNQAPAIESQAITSVALGETYRYDLRATDSEGDALTYELVNGPAGMTIDSRGRVLWPTQAGVPASNPITLRVTDSYGAVATQDYVLTVTPDTTAPRVELRLSANPVALGEYTVVVVQASDNVGIANVQLTLNGEPVVLDANRSVTLHSDIAGLYALRARVRDASGNEGVAEVNLRVFDPADTQGPTIVLTSPQPNATITSHTDIVGSITDDNLQFYRIDYARADLVDINKPEANDPDYKTLATGNTGAIDKVLATFDPTMLLNDDYVIRIVAQDLSGNVSTKVVPLSLDGQLKLGQFKLDFNDLTIPVAGIPITITRTYDSRNANAQGDFGYGWSLSVQDAQIRETIPVNPLEEEGLFFAATPFREGTKIYLTNPEGRRVGFTFKPERQFSLFGGGSYVAKFEPDPGVYDQLDVGSVPLRSINGLFYSAFFGDPFNPSAYRLTTKNGTVYEYDQFTGLANIQDKNGNRIELRPDGIVSSGGPSIQFVRDAQGRISKIIDPAGNALVYDYDIDGNLVSYMDQSGTETTYRYLDLPEHFLDTIIDSRGVTIFDAEFDAAGRFIGSKDAAGNSASQDFDVDDSSFTTTDAKGNPTKRRYDDLGRIVEQVDALSNKTIYEYGDARNPYLETRIVDGNGNATSYEYDTLGNITSKTDALGNVSRYSYNSSNNLVQSMDPLGRTESYTYDSRNHLLARIDSAGNKFLNGYDELGRLASKTDALGNLMNYTHIAGCACGQPDSVVNADGSVMRFEYNSLTNLTKITDETGKSTTFEYDQKGRRLRSLGPDGQETQYVYDGDRLKELWERIDADSYSVTRFEYDDFGRVIKSTDANGGATTYRFDANGNREMVRDSLGNETTYVFDALNRVIEAKDAFGYSTRYEYDAVGNQTAIIDRNGDRRDFEYDKLNRLVGESWVNQQGIETYEANWTYDVLGNMLSASDNYSKLTYQYDTLNRIVTVDNAGTALQPHVILTYAYDGNSNLISAKDNLGVEVTTEFDNRRRAIAQVWNGSQWNVRVETDYSTRNELTEIRRYSDKQGLALVGRTAASFDSKSQITDLQIFGNQAAALFEYEFDYDFEGRLISKTTDGNVGLLSYDAKGQLTGVDNSVFADESYTYDLNGNRTSSHLHGSGYVVGTNNQLLSDGTYSYQYDRNGRMTQRKEIATGATIDYSYDVRGRLTRTVEKTSTGIILNESNFTYDIFDRRILSQVNGQNKVIVYHNNDAWADFGDGGQLSAHYLFGSGTDDLVARHTLQDGVVWYLKDNLGSVVGLLNNSGTLLAKSVYDSFGNQIAQTGAGSDRFGFTGRETESVGGTYYYRARNFDPQTGRFTSEDPIGFRSFDVNLFRYGFNSPTKYVDPMGTTAVESPSTLAVTIGGAIGNLLQGLFCSLMGETASQFIKIKSDNLDNFGKVVVSGLGAGGFGAFYGIVSARLLLTSATAKAVSQAALNRAAVISGATGGAIGGTLGCIAGVIVPVGIEWVSTWKFPDMVISHPGAGPDIFNYTPPNLQNPSPNPNANPLPSS